MVEFIAGLPLGGTLFTLFIRFFSDSADPIGSMGLIQILGVDLKLLVLSVVCDDLLYAKMTFGES